MPVTTTFRSLSSPEVALGLAFDVLSSEPEVACVGLVEHRPSRHGIAVALCGPAPVHAVSQLASGLVAGAQGRPGVRMAYVSLLDGGDDVGVPRLATWAALIAVHEEGGAVLLDWLTVAPGAGVTSYAEKVGPAAVW